MKTVATCMACCLVFSGCMAELRNMPELRNYNKTEEVKPYIELQVDDFKKTEIVVGPRFYFNRSLNSGTYCFLRSWKVGTQFRHQLYVSILNLDWVFFKSAVWSDGRDAVFVDIDDNVGVGSFTKTAYVVETFGIDLSMERLQAAVSERAPLLVRAYGKRGSQDIKLPAGYVIGYFEYIQEMERRGK